MSQQNINQGMQNGIPSNWGGIPPMVPSQKNQNYTPQILNNGLGSSQSSRDSSPSTRRPTVPVSQLPPVRGNIPVTQLPPGRPGVSPIPHTLETNINSNSGHLSASVSQISDITPHSSPKVSNFSTSTPIPQPPNLNPKTNDIPSAVTPAKIVQQNNLNSYANTDVRSSMTASVNKVTSFTSSNYTPTRSYNTTQQKPPSNVDNSQQHATMAARSIQQQPAFNIPPPQGLPTITAAIDPRANFLSGQATSLSHASSTPSLSQPTVGALPLRQDLNQPQALQRPVSSGPQLQNFEQNLSGEPLKEQSQIPQSQNMPPHSQQTTSTVRDASRQLNAPTIDTNNMNQQPRPLGINQPYNVNAVQQNVVGPQFAPTAQRPSVVLDNRVPANNLNYPTQTASRPAMQNMYGANIPQPVVAPPAVAPVSVNPPATNYPPTTGSNIHSKRYPQPQNQQFPSTNQQGNVYPQPNSNLPNNTIPAQNSNIPPTNNFNQPPTNAYPQQQQPNAYYQQQTNVYNQQQQQQQSQQYPTNYQQPTNQPRNYQQNVTQQMSNLNIVKSGFSKLWGQDNYDLLQCPNVLPEEQLELPKVKLGQEYLDAANCSPEIFRCTMTKIPESNSLLQKSRLPLGVLIHPFKDLNHLPVIQCNTIVRCRACRTYINPFIFFVDTKRWKCNLCYRVNELPEEFQYDPVSKSYGDPSRRPEIKSSTIEYIAPSEYMLRPPQPAVYLFLLDISRLAIESGYLHTICEVLSSQLATLPGDARTQIGFLAYNSTLHFFSLAEGLSQPHEMIVSDVDDVFLPCPDNLLVNLKEHLDLISDLLAQLPTRYQNSFDSGSALGAALQVAFKMMSSTGGRVTVFQSSLPMLGPGALVVREDPNQRAGKEAPHLNPATDFYKRLALDCSGHQVAVDLFILNSQYVDIATLSGISRFSGGCMYHFPLFKASRTLQAESLERSFRRYLTRKIGFEAVMRIRCTRGLAIHTFHGNFFVRSTDLLSLPNVNPDAGFGMQVSIEESLSDLQTVCFQAALLYTSSKGERRIRVHTLCLPVVTTLSDVLNSADQQCIVGLLAKMAVDRSLQSSLSDARDAFINVAIDILSSYKLSLNMGSSNSGLQAPQCLKLLPLYILALLKYPAFRTGQSTRLDDRVFAMCDMKTLPLSQLVQNVYPDLYPIYRLSECPNIVDNEGVVIPQPRRLQLTSRNIDSHGAYLLDAGLQMIIYVCPNVSQTFLTHTIGVPNYSAISDQCYELPKIDHPDNQRLHAFMNSLNDEKPYVAALQIMRDNSPNRTLMIERLIEDRIEFALSYNEFLQHLKTQVK